MKYYMAKTITAFVPGTVCNLRCKYCYVGQCVDETHSVPTKFNYPIHTMIAAFSPERIGGIANIVVISAGETLLSNSIILFIHGLLKQGHIVEVVTNLTLSNRVDELLNLDSQYLKRLIVKGSLHWTELKRLSMVDIYFNNMTKIIQAGGSSYPFVTLSQEHYEAIDEIRATCLERIGALPHCSPQVQFRAKDDINKGGEFECSPKLTPSFKETVKNKLDSKVFELCARFIDIHPRELYCFAGKYSYSVYLDTGMIGKCHGCESSGNFFENLNTKIELTPIGRDCKISSCGLQYNFIAQGLLAGYDNIPRYSELLYRKGLFTDEVMEILSKRYRAPFDEITFNIDEVDKKNRGVSTKNAFIDIKSYIHRRVSRFFSTQN